MSRITRLAPLLIILALTAVPAQAAQRVKSCIGSSSASALNQYCEDVPTASGGTAPGTTDVGSTLPGPVVRRIEATRTGDPRRQLLAIPVGDSRAHHSARVGTGHPSAAKVSTSIGDVKTSPSSIGLGLILVLALSALALVGIALERRRRNGNGTGTDAG